MILHSKATLVFTRAEAADTSRLATTLLCTLMRRGSEATQPAPLEASTLTWYLGGGGYRTDGQTPPR